MTELENNSRLSVDPHFLTSRIWADKILDKLVISLKLMFLGFTVTQD